MNYMFEKLKPHIGHRIECVAYGESPDDIADIYIECETCNEVLVSAEDYDFEDES